MKRLFVLAAWSLMAVTAGAQTATTFEMRYFTPDAAADGVTDFHGETEWFTTPQRVEVLGKYARYASRFWGDPGLDTPLFGESAVAEALSRIKPQPLTSVRRTIPLEKWRATGYKKGKEADVARRWTQRDPAVALPFPLPPDGLSFHRLSDDCLVMGNRILPKWGWLFAGPLLGLHLGIKAK